MGTFGTDKFVVFRKYLLIDLSPSWLQGLAGAAGLWLSWLGGGGGPRYRPGTPDPGATQIQRHQGEAQVSVVC